MSKLKWTIRGHKEVVYTGTLKNITFYTGYAKLMHTDGSLYAQGQCLNGFKTGLWKYYHTDDQVMQQTNYDDKGREQGEERSYYPNGALKGVHTYKDGKPSGDGYTYHENGAVDSWNTYDDKGASQFIREYSDTGVLRLYCELVDGRLKLEQYFHPDGALWQESQYENGILVRQQKFENVGFKVKVQQ